MIDSNGFDTKFKCKFSQDLGSKVEPKFVCALTQITVECNGEGSDRRCCPKWSGGF